MTRGKAAFGNELLEIGGELQQAHGIDDGRAIFAGAVADVFWGEISSAAMRWKAMAVSMGFRSSRWMFSIRVISRRWSSGMS